MTDHHAALEELKCGEKNNPCFDRMVFRGYLPIMSGWQMAQFFNSPESFRELKTTAGISN